jgi:pimeloyl-ACP methyl ester carboxylesterase
VFGATSNGGADPAVIEAWIGIARTCPVSRVNVARQLVAAARFRLPERLEVPGLVLASAADRMVSPECSRAIARSWGLPLREHPRAGHDLTLDAPAWAAGQIAAWRVHRFGPAPEG